MLFRRRTPPHCHAPVFPPPPKSRVLQFEMKRFADEKIFSFHYSVTSVASRAFSFPFTRLRLTLRRSVIGTDSLGRSGRRFFLPPLPLVIDLHFPPLSFLLFSLIVNPSRRGRSYGTSPPFSFSSVEYSSRSSEHISLPSPSQRRVESGRSSIPLFPRALLFFFPLSE